MSDEHAPLPPVGGRAARKELTYETLRLLLVVVTTLLTVSCAWNCWQSYQLSKAYYTVAEANDTIAEYKRVINACMERCLRRVIPLLKSFDKRFLPSPFSVELQRGFAFQPIPKRLAIRIQLSFQSRTDDCLFTDPGVATKAL